MARFFDIIIALQRDSIALQAALLCLLGGVTAPNPSYIFAPAASSYILRSTMHDAS